MALTMTRTRTQTALTKLAQLLADVNGELSFIAEIIERSLVKLDEMDRSRLQRRRDHLQKSRAALCITLRQFDPSLDPENIGASADWLRTRSRVPRSRQRAYLSTLREPEGPHATPTGGVVSEVASVSTPSAGPVQLRAVPRR